MACIWLPESDLTLPTKLFSTSEKSFPHLSCDRYSQSRDWTLKLNQTTDFIRHPRHNFEENAKVLGICLPLVFQWFSITCNWDSMETNILSLTRNYFLEDIFFSFWDSLLIFSISFQCSLKQCDSLGIRLGDLIRRFLISFIKWW